MERSIENKEERLRSILRSMRKVLVAYSGGVDSTLLLKVARDTLGKENTLAVTALSPLYPERERALAERMARTEDVRHLWIESNELEIEGFSKNPPNRCYLCKKDLFEKLWRLAEERGIDFVVEGSTLDDEKDHRPGRFALQELSIRSPLSEAGFTKDEVRELSKRLDLATWEKPSSACLASRFPYGEKITLEALKKVDEAEGFLIHLGFKQVRVRHYGPLARIEILEEEIERLLDASLRKTIVAELKKIGYRYVTLDLQGFRSGSMNEVFK